MNKKLIQKVQKGTHCIEFVRGEAPNELRKVLSACFPNSKQEVFGTSNYYYKSDFKNEWADWIKKPENLTPIPLHQFFEELPSTEEAPLQEVREDKIPLRLQETYTTAHVIEKLLWATEYLLHQKNYDGHSHEELKHCTILAKEILKAIHERHKAIVSNTLQEVSVPSCQAREILTEYDIHEAAKGWAENTDYDYPNRVSFAAGANYVLQQLRRNSVQEVRDKEEIIEYLKKLIPLAKRELQAAEEIVCHEAPSLNCLIQKLESLCNISSTPQPASNETHVKEENP